MSEPIFLRRKTWYLRTVVPTSLRAQFGKSVIVESLKTRDFSEAKVRGAERRAVWLRRFQSPDDAHAPQEVYRGTLQDFTDGAAVIDEGEREGRMTAIEEEVDDILETEEAAFTKANPDWERHVSPSPEEPHLRPSMHPKFKMPPATKARYDGLLDAHRKLRGDKAEKESAYASTFAQAAELYLKDKRKTFTPQTLRQTEVIIRLFDSFYGTKPFLGVTRKTVSTFFAQLRSLNPLWGRTPDAKTLKFTELVQRYGNHTAGLAPKTVNRYADTLSQIWVLARRRDEVSGDNPFIGFREKIKAHAREKQWLPYEPDELRRLFGSKPNKDVLLHEIGLVGLYSGMRLNEICSLRWADVRQDQGLWFFDVRKSKTPAGQRRVPMHSRLEWLLDRRGEPEELVWPALAKYEHDGGKYGARISRDFTRYRRGRGGDQPYRSFHSLRKNFIQALQHAGVPEVDTQEIVGHEKQGLTYGTYSPHGQPMTRRKEIVEKVQYPSLER
jgi:integrase